MPHDVDANKEAKMLDKENLPPCKTLTDAMPLVSDPEAKTNSSKRKNTIKLKTLTEASKSKSTLPLTVTMSSTIPL